MNRLFLRKQASVSSIPSLQDGATWLSDAKAKFDVFAKTFAGKAELLPEVVDTAFFDALDVEFIDFNAVRSRMAKRLLRGLEANKFIRQDKISVAILKRLSDCIAAFFPTWCDASLTRGVGLMYGNSIWQCQSSSLAQF